MTNKVLIVGAGPVGQTMALELARYQVPVRLVDKMTERSNTSRAVGIWPRTLELLDRAGHISEELIALGNQVTVANIVAGDEVIARIELKDIDTPYPFALMLPQNDTEAVLERHLERLGTRSELGIELTELTQEADGITATLTHADGRIETERLGWLIACDGSHSSIRHDLGLAFEGESMDTDWGQGDFHMAGCPYPLNELATFWHQEGPIVFFPMAPGRYRLIASLGPSTDKPPVAPSLDAFQAIVDRRGPGGITLTDPIWTSAFRINERQVASYRVGRVFLAGDAAHVHSPAGAQGMNTGMQDAFNLAWKLALVCRGLGGEAPLLDSYDVERRAVGAEVIKASGRLTNIAMLQHPVAQHVRNALLHFVLGLAPVQHALEGSMTETSTRYDESPLNGVSRRGHARAGQRLPPLEGETPYGGGDTPRFTVRANPSAGEPPPGVLNDLVDPAIRPNLVAGGIELVRPDDYVAMSVADGEWTSVATYLDQLRVVASPQHEAAGAGTSSLTVSSGRHGRARREEVDMRSLSRDGVRLAFESREGPRPPILFVHGWCCDHTYFEPQVEWFARRGHHVIAVDLRGHGESDKPRQRYTMGVFADDLAWTAEQLKLSKPIVVGHSMGGIVAYDLAVRYPDLPTAIVMIDAAVVTPAATRGLIAPFLEQLRGPEYRAAVRHYVDTALFIPTDDPERKERILDRMSSAPQHVVVSAYEGLRDYEAGPGLSVPSLYIAADEPTARSDMASLLVLAPDLVHGRTVGAGHFCQLEVPEQVDAMIERFLTILYMPSPSPRPLTEGRMTSSGEHGRGTALIALPLGS